MKLSRRSLLTAAAGLTAGAVARAQPIGEHGYQVTHTELWTELDPAHDGLRVAQLSDIHVGASTPEQRVRAAVAQLNALAPDLVFLTGDFVTYSKQPLTQLSHVLAGIAAPTFAVLGNHDHLVDAVTVRTELEWLGYATLRNQHTRFQARGVGLTILGVDDGGTGHADVAKAFAGAPAGGTRLVLTHNPVTSRALPEQAGLVCFSGHTHGGQLVVPPVTDALMRAAGQPYIRGVYSVGGNQLYVNRGLGFGRRDTFLHHGSEPELAVFTLRRRDC